MTSASSGARTAAIAAVVSALITGAAIGGTFLMRNQLPQNADITRMSDLQRQAIEQTVRDYLIKNPEILVELSNELEKRQSTAQATAMRSALAENSEALFRSKSDPVVGNPTGDVTVVEFFDYNCGYCKRAFNDLVRLMETDSKVRVVLKEFPILRRESEGAARVVLAAKAQGKYFEMHRALMQSSGVSSADTALAAAAKLGLDVEKLKADMKSAEVDKVLAEAKTLAEKIGVQGTPLYLIGDRVIPGAPEDLHDQLTEKVQEVRKQGCTAPVVC